MKSGTPEAPTADSHLDPGELPVLVAHNRYRQRGGEDVVVTAEVELLEARGHRVARYAVDNREFSDSARSSVALRAIWNHRAFRGLTQLIEARRPVVAHFHNTFPLLSPAVLYAAQRAGVAVVQTLHNYRLLCPNALFFRDGGVCEDCLGKTVAWPSVVHACYRGSRRGSAVVAGMLATHRAAGTWRHAVDGYIALTDFARRKFIEGGLPADRIHVKPNFLAADPGVGGHLGGFALFVGRPSPEKGVGTLLEAWGRLGDAIPLKVAGSRRPAAAPQHCSIEWLGELPRDRVLALMQDAAVLIFPSECYEGCPMVLVEALATGLPIIASRLGAAGETVMDGGNGRHFAPGDPAELAATVEWALAHRPEMADMGRRGRGDFEARYTATQNYAWLRDIYRAVIERARS